MSSQSENSNLITKSCIIAATIFAGSVGYIVPYLWNSYVRTPPKLKKPEVETHDMEAINMPQNLKAMELKNYIFNIFDAINEAIRHKSFDALNQYLTIMQTDLSYQQVIHNSQDWYEYLTAMKQDLNYRHSKGEMREVYCYKSIIRKLDDLIVTAQMENVSSNTPNSSNLPI